MSRKPRRQSPAPVAQVLAPVTQTETAISETTSEDTTMQTETPVAVEQPVVEVLPSTSPVAFRSMLSNTEAYEAATLIARRFKSDVYFSFNNLDEVHVAPSKTTRATSAATPRAPRKVGEPMGKRKILVEMALRPEGASGAELAVALGWVITSPWKWEYTNKTGRGVADVYGYDLRIAKDDQGKTRFYLTKPTPVEVAEQESAGDAA